MLKQPIYITALSSISALGSSLEEIWLSYKKLAHLFKKSKIENDSVWMSTLTDDIYGEIEKLRASDAKYTDLDNSVLYAIYTSRKTIEEAGWNEDSNFGINIGSSRGATALFETYYEEFLQTGRTSTLASPTTTLGNISSWVSHDLKSKGPDISHSITCSTSLHSILNAVAWLQSGLTDKFLIGGSEAALTPFTIAQMQALKIYSKIKSDFPCRALDFDKKQNTMVLGEGASMACLEIQNSKKAMAEILGLGYATEPLQHNVSISADAQCFQLSMKMALGDIPKEHVDAIVMHAPGTVKGDNSEYRAIQKVFGENLPALTSNKWMIGHTFGASGMLSVEMAVLMLRHQEFISVPFFQQDPPKSIDLILVNAVGFGGNAVSILLKNPTIKDVGTN